MDSWCESRECIWQNIFLPNGHIIISYPTFYPRSLPLSHQRVVVWIWACLWLLPWIECSRISLQVFWGYVTSCCTINESPLVGPGGWGANSLKRPMAVKVWTIKPTKIQELVTSIKFGGPIDLGHVRVSSLRHEHVYQTPYMNHSVSPIPPYHLQPVTSRG